MPLPEAEALLSLVRQYADAGRAWMTPVETFQPHYAEALARRMLQTHSARYPGEPLQVLEVGGGNGTCAAGVLSYLRREAPETYASSKYMLVEVSERLAEVQRVARLAHPHHSPLTTHHSPLTTHHSPLTTHLQP